MPQIQVLPYVQSPLEQLTPYINQAFGDVATGIHTGMVNRKDNALLEQMKNAQTPMEAFGAFAKLSQERQKSISPVYGPMVREQAKSEGKEDIANKKSQEELKGLNATLNQLEEDIPYTGTKLLGAKSFFGGIPGTEAFEKRQQYDASGFLATDKVFTKFNKGTITKEKLKVIREDLAPNSNLTERTNRARIRALRLVMGLPSNVSEEKLDATVKAALKGTPKETAETTATTSERPSLESFIK